MRINRWLGTMLVIVLFSKAGLSQQLRLGNNPWTVEKSAVLELQSSNQGLLFTRIADTALINALNPPDGMVVYFTPSKQLLLRANGYWQSLAHSGTTNNYWSIAGNSNGEVKQLGTTDNYALPFITNNTERMRISSSGNVGIGTTSPSQMLDVNGTIVSSATTYPNYGYNTANRMAFGESNVPANETGSVVQFGSGSNTRNMLFAFTKTNVNTSFLGNDGTQMMLGTESTAPITFRTGLNYYATNIMGSGTEAMRITSSGVGIGVTDPSNQLVVKDVTEIRRVGSLAQLIFSNTSGSGDFRIAGDGGDMYWQGGGGRALQMGSYHTAILGGDRQTTSVPDFTGGITNTGVLVLGQRDASVPFAIQANSATQTANLTEWRSPSTALSVVDKNGNFGIGTSTPSTKLHIIGTNPLTLTGVQTGTNTAADSLLTITNGLVRKLPLSTIGAGSGWALNGNTVGALNTIGTVDNYDLPFITNNTEKMRLTSDGNLGIGTTDFDGDAPEKVLIDAGVTDSYNLLIAKGERNGYLQFNIQNNSSQGQASTDIVATANNGTETTNYVNLGINGGGYNSANNILSGPNNGYLFSAGQDFIIGNSATTKSLILFTGGISGSNERMRITSAGKVGIGTTSPAEVLDVTGNLKLTGAFMPGGSAGTAGYVLTSNGAGSAPTWTASAATSSWLLDGNSVSSVKNLGTTSNYSLPFITNNTERMRITNTGNVGIGTSTFNGTNPEKLLVHAGTTSSYNLINAKGSINNYLQLNIQNLSSGTAASSDIVATANNGTESVNFVNLGINSSGYSSTGVLGGANNAYLYSTGSDFVIGNSIADKNLLFFTGGSNTTNERMRIDGNGNLGIATNAPASKLDVNGSAGLGIVTTSSNLTLDETNYTVIITGGTPAITLPAASTCARRIYIIVNHTLFGRTISAYLNFSGASVTSVGGSSSITIQSDGTNWYRIQ